MVGKVLSQHTLDGNHHLNKYTKNTDPDDVSLFDGHAYFPRASDQKEYLASLPTRSKEKVVCEHLKAQEKQNRKKFKNMDVTGVVQVQCRHVLVKSTVDLQLGERFTNTDYALATWMRQGNLQRFENIRKMYSYDIACGYEVNVVPRFEASFPDLVNFVRSDVQWLIPLVHVQNHKSNCMYMYASSYITGAGHFHGETSEMVWAESNQLGAQTRQMNAGHRHDTIINATSDWNWKKISNMANTLMGDVKKAHALFEEKRDIYRTLTLSHASLVEEWRHLDRDKRTVVGGEVQCVYRQNSQKLMTQAKVYEAMLQEVELAGTLSDLNPSSANCAKSTVARFLSDALNVLATQRKIRLLLAHCGDSLKFQAPSNEIAKLREQLSRKLDKLRQLQLVCMPQVEALVKKHFIQNKEVAPEDDMLYLPSDIDVTRRAALGLTALANDERKLLEGAANDAIQAVQRLTKVCSNAAKEKATQGSGQAHHTRASNVLREIKFRRDLAMLDYNELRLRLVSLGLPENDPVYRPLTIKDLFRKPTVNSRSVGDTYRSDGSLWAGNAERHLPPTGSQIALQSNIATQGSKANKRKAPERNEPSKRPKKDGRTNDEADGWIWSFSGRSQITHEELQVWLDESDRVQWFRAEAEMERWLEEWEIQQADYIRCIRSFATTATTWKQLVVTPCMDSNSVQLGKNAYAMKKAAMYTDMEKYAIELLTEQGYGHLLDKRKAVHEHLDERRTLSLSSLPYCRLNTATI